jgi:phenylacetate-CoA ligase
MSLEDKLYPLLSVYESMPLGVRKAIGAGWRMLPNNVRLGERFDEFERLVGDCENWSAEQIAGYQLEQVRNSVHEAWRNCPFYEERFLAAGFDAKGMNSLADLRNCPTTSKRDLQENLAGMASRNRPEAERLYLTTGGSTGVPVGFYLQKGVSRPKEQAFLEGQWRRAGYEPGMRLAVIRGQVTDEKSDGRIAFYDATRNWLMLSSYHLTEARLPEYLAAIEEFQPDLLHAYPSAALQLAEYLETSGQAWRTKIRAVLCGSERLNIPQKRLLERVFNCRVYRWYGHSERVVLAGEGRDSDRFYFWPAYGYVEFGDPDAEGYREVIGTSFHNHAMPLIRYRTGDYVKLADDAPGEFPWPAVTEIAGREQEFLVSRSGRRISLTAVNMHGAIFDDLYAVQFYQEERGVAELRYVAGPGFHTSRLDEIRAGVQRKLGDDFTIEIVPVAETEKTTRGKHRWLVSKLTP